MSGNRQTSQAKTRKITLIVLGVLVAGTVFLLPQFVTEPWVEGNLDELAPVPEGSPSAVTPSTAAELTRYRQESQGVLAEIVTVRDDLRERDVDDWAQPEFQRALDHVDKGDQAYSYGDYAESLEQFREARSQLAEIERMRLELLAKAKTDTTEAIRDLNPMMASTAIQLAVSIAPEDPEVQALSGRAETLEQVARHIENGDDALARDRYADAQAEYREAVDLDPLHQRARESLARADKAVQASVFRGHMSRGFAALEQGDHAGARRAFQEAGRVRPGDPAIEKALAQVNNRESAGIVGLELERAAALESNEEWREAQAVYEGLLKRDPSLTEAKVKLIPAQVRADLDDRLESYVEEPFSLSNKANFLAAQNALADARGIANPGPRLSRQIERVDELLRLANSAVDVVFRSDNQTHVVLFRVAELGRFDQVSVKLRPGKYVAAGTRSGFRDVRVEFTVTGEPQPQPIVVRCEEPVG